MTMQFFSRPVRIATVAALSIALGACSGGLFGSGGKKNTTPTVGERLPVLSRIENGAKVDPALQGIAVVIPPQQTNADWAQAGGTASKAYGHLSLSDNPARVWTASIPGSTLKKRLAAAPVVGNGKLLVVDTEARVHAFDAQTGTRLWTTQMPVGETARNTGFGGGVSYSAGRAYATNGAGDVVALDAQTGAILWQQKPGGPLRGAPTLAFNSVYVMTQDNQIFALDAADGSLDWQESGSAGQSGVFGVAAPAAGQGTVVTGYSTGELTAYRYENGRTLWSDALARTSISTEVGSLTDIDADPIIDRGRVFALGQGGRMASYELVTGQRIWELNLAGISTPAVAGEWIFTLTDDAQLLAIARNSGKVRWISKLANYKNEDKKKNRIFWTGPVLAGNQLWVASSRGDVYRVSVSEGSASLFQNLGDSISLPPIVANNMLYILDDNGKIHAFR